MSVERSKLQLVGTACLMIAAKYEEIYPPGVEEFALITDNTYTNKQVQQRSISSTSCSPNSITLCFRFSAWNTSS